MKTMMGIADCHGIESFRDEKDLKGNDKFCLLIRAEANRQRHAVMYYVDMDDQDVELANTMLKKEKWTRALQFIKRKAVRVGFPANKMDLYRKSWNMIPNPQLDPWRT